MGSDETSNFGKWYAIEAHPMKFTEFLATWKAHETVSTEDILSCFLPLVQETIATHQLGLVAPLQGVDDLQVDHHRLWFEEHRRAAARTANGKIVAVEAKRDFAWDVVAETYRELDVDTGLEKITQQGIADDSRPDVPDRIVQRPVYYKNYVTWEHTLENHDPLTDVFSLGMILASLALQLDFHDGDDLQQFVAHRHNLFALNRSLHPVLAQAIVQMTELYRAKRSQDLQAILFSLTNYRDQIVSLDVQLALDQLNASSEPKTRSASILFRLRDRLFDLTRRNPLLHFRSTAQAFNLTHASIPLAINIDNIREDQLFVWNDELQSKVAKGQAIRLNQHVNFNEVAYAPSVLERLMADARRDKNEYGCSQLRLVVAFLGWSNLKEKPIESYVSPLILLPVQINKLKGIRDTFSFEAIDTQAEVNPVIRHLFRQLYNIALPETIDLSESSMAAFFQLLQTQIVANEPAISLTRIERPQIELVHEKAKRRLDQYRRSSRVAGRGVSRFETIDYSYDALNYHPLGVRLFSQRVRQPAFRLQQIVARELPKRSYVAPEPEQHHDDSTITVERSLAIVRDTASDNPYQWTFDTCNLTLVNLHYRRMSLVRDYETILEQNLQNVAFDAAFADAPRQVTRRLPDAIPIHDRYDVVTSDPTQSMAVAESRTGQSYIIQGPPGTGKSQTITNLIADFAARGKRVLFVCEKRAAIDVVYARLKQSGLGSLCTLVHDSQADKKEFVLDLKETYESFTAPEAPAKAKAKSPKKGSREQVIERLNDAIKPLERLELAMESAVESPDGSVSCSMRELLDRCIVNRNRCPVMSPEELQLLPSLSLWWQHQNAVKKIQLRLDHLLSSKLLSSHPLRSLRASILQTNAPIDCVKQAAQQSLEQLEQLNRAVKASGIASESLTTIKRIHQLLEYLELVSVFANGENLQLLDARSTQTSLYRKGLKKLQQLRLKLESARKRNVRWKMKLSREETRIAVPQARSFQGRLTRWLSPTWWRLRSVLSQQYDFANFSIQPTWVQILDDLEQEYLAEGSLQEATDSLVTDLELSRSPDEIQTALNLWENRFPKLPSWIADVHRRMVASPEATDIIQHAGRVAPWLEALRESCEPLLDHWLEHSPESLRQELEGVAAHSTEVPKVADLLRELDSLPPRLNRVLRTSSHSITQLEVAVEAQAWQQWLQSEPEIERFTAREHAVHVQRMEEEIDPWMATNANQICRRTRERFLERMQHDPTNPALAKRYQLGRKLLEHEFGKTMRYRAIRDLVDGDSGLVVNDLKPIWLMSPLSVSDTLPLQNQFVDVVIFDEASQVRLEDSIPTLFRGAQTIIVGDTMQLPPTNFFSQRAADDDSDITTEGNGVRNDESLPTFDLSSDSLLSHCGKYMESTMLGWHYRSRSESLISFSNWAFYDGRLLTVPDPRRTQVGSSTVERTVKREGDSHLVRERNPNYEISEPKALAAGRANIAGLRAEAGAYAIQSAHPSRPLDFHFLQDGCYEERRNRKEAEHIAELVARWLAKESGESLGIIAFSEAQQAEIERALDERASNDEDFRTRYEYELQREENGQFVGLLVKNLENIQGDERDVILLSVCYGPNRLGKISMNFGPINRDGGEKRLNVAFSRAKKNMIVVSSMKHTSITNDYNLGPNCLKQYLRYVECMSNADTQGAELALHQLSRWRGQHDSDSVPNDPVTSEITEALRARGFCVDNQVGQSHFRIDVAVYRESDDRYRLGIIVDTASSYRQSDPWERDLMRPRLLRDFGWTIHRVLGKDWYQDPTGQIDLILSLL